VYSTNAPECVNKEIKRRLKSMEQFSSQKKIYLYHFMRNGRAFHDPTIKELGVLSLHLSGTEKEENGPQE